AQFPHRIVPGKIELEDAHLRLVRDSAGKWNVQGITKPAAESERAPVLVLKKARVEVIDQKTGSTAVLDLQEMDLTVINDPVTVFTFEAKGKSKPIGPFHARGRYERGVGAAGTLDLGSIVLGTELARLAGMAAPEGVDDLKTVSGVASSRTRWTWKPGRQPPIAYDTELELRDGRCTNPALPAPVEELALKAHIKDGDLSIENLTAKFGGSGISVKLEIDPPKAEPDVPLVLISPADAGERVRRIEITVSDLLVGPELFERLPARFAEARALFAPAGPADVTYEQRREPTGIKKRLVFRAKGMTAKYREFPYPVDHIRGTIE